MTDQKKISRRQALGAALAGGAAASLTGTATAEQEADATASWDLEADIVCVGSGAVSKVMACYPSSSTSLKHSTATASVRVTLSDSNRTSEGKIVECKQRGKLQKPKRFRQAQAQLCAVRDTRREL